MVEKKKKIQYVKRVGSLLGEEEQENESPKSYASNGEVCGV